MPRTFASMAGRRAVITGGLSGIGLAAARFFAAAGASLVLIDRSVPRQGGLTDLGFGQETTFLQADVSDDGGIAEAMKSAAEWLGGIDALVTAAGIARAGTAPETPLRDLDDVLSVNLKGTFLCCRAAIPVMRRSGGGSIVTIASEQGMVGVPAMAAYCASKGGVVQLTRALAVDHARDGIRVNCVCPGPILTPMLEAFLDGTGDRAGQLKKEAATTLLGRVGKAEEIAAAVQFLTSSAASFVTGVILPVDGGATAH